MPNLFVIIAAAIVSLSNVTALGAEAPGKRLAYLVSDLSIPFWQIMQRGIAHRAQTLGYQFDVYNAENSARRELQSAVQAIGDKVDGILLSPTNSSAAVTILKLAGKAEIPVVIADVGTDSGDYVSYVASDNRDGSYQLGRLLAKTMQRRHWTHGNVGIIAIPQKRANGQARTAGFLKALAEAGIKASDLRQQIDFSYRETYHFATQLIATDPELRAIWLQGSDRYQAALDAIGDAGKTGQILLICFDAEPEFLDMIRQGRLVGAGMQQPFLMGERALDLMDAHLRGLAVPHQTRLPVLVVSKDNIENDLQLIRRNVLGLDIE